MEWQLFKQERPSDRIAVDPLLDEEEALAGIRCPLCAWRPSPAGSWCCECRSTPEPFFASCGTVWNTFLTNGRCPGCAHQWQWTSCLRCEGWSLHLDWYEPDRPDV